MASSIPLSAANTTPPLAVLKPYYLEGSYVSYKDDETAVIAAGVFSPRVKIAVETAQRVEPEKTLVNLRFCYSNRYIGRREGSVIPIAHLKQPDEDTTKTTSTLFELKTIDDIPNLYYFFHVQSGSYLVLNEARDTLEITNWPDDIPLACFQVVDWDSFVKLPKSVAFKGTNGRYLKGYSFKELPYLQFSADDPNLEESVQEAELLSDGFVKIKSLYFSGNYWRNSIFWILADSKDSSTTDPSLRFWPVKLNDTTIALRSALNNNYCVPLTADDVVDCLDARSAATITADAPLVVKELVLNRKLFNVTYRMADARILNEEPYIAASTTVDNETDVEAIIVVSITYTDSRSCTFSNSTSLNTGVPATITADLLWIVEGSIYVTSQITESFESGKTNTFEKSIMVTGTVTVPPKTKATVNYVGTLGTCDVPFSYTQQDKSSIGGIISYTDEDDGNYTGVNAYNFSFQVQKYEPL